MKNFNTAKSNTAHLYTMLASMDAPALKQLNLNAMPGCLCDVDTVIQGYYDTLNATQRSFAANVDAYNQAYAVRDFVQSHDGAFKAIVPVGKA